MKIGIIGLGFVGSAVKNAYDLQGIEIICRDPQLSTSASISELLDADGIFICVPSPRMPSGECDTSILESVLAELKEYSGVLISKVTATPTAYKRIYETHPNLVHAPEFLVAATAKEDYINGQFAIIGGNIENCELAYKIILLGQPKAVLHKFCSIEEASLSKYAINTFLATKIIFMNQLKQLADTLNIEYNVIKECITFDSRLGNSHMSVPGPDGSIGFGGACFPKDSEALLYESKELGVRLSLLNEAVYVNKKLRSENSII